MSNKEEQQQQQVKRRTKPSPQPPPSSPLDKDDDKFFEDFEKTKKRKITQNKRIHYAFTFIYAIFSTFIIISNVIWINTISIWKSGILGFFHIETGVMVAILIVGNLMKPGKKMQYRRFRIFRSSAIAVIILSIIAAAFSIIYILDLSSILILQCPSAGESISITPETFDDTTSSIDIDDDNNNNNEDNDILKKILNGVKKKKKEEEDNNIVKITTIGNVIDVLTSSTSEDEAALSKTLTDYMCANEKALMIALLVVLGLMVFLNVITIYFYVKVLR